jgi:hypothetical protein
MLVEGSTSESDVRCGGYIVDDRAERGLECLTVLLATRAVY